MVKAVKQACLWSSASQPSDLLPLASSQQASASSQQFADFVT